MALKQQKGLGRGLDAIFGADTLSVPKAARAMETPGEIAVSDIHPNPNQPRRHFDDGALAELADSIRVLGVIQPVTVKAGEDGTYIIISGERRWRASQMAGLETIPVYVRQADNQTLHEMALVENIQRQDLNAMEVALSLKRLMDECGLTQEKLAERVGMKRPTIANYLRLLKLPDEVQLAVKEGYFSMGHAKAVASAPEGKQLGLLKKVIGKNLSVRQTEELVAGMAGPKREPQNERELPESYSRLVERLEKLLPEGVNIKTSSRGRLVLEFPDEGIIDSFIDRIKGA
ncbi:MAG: ParB/RepB/Spo0J family partition protein [Alistipes sp.]|jgi:ParB family chromosome partitioning protein|nr:ParB/RepB/Spo0J family partition protein [Alistipes sp.]